jgi:hypothetical protein
MALGLGIFINISVFRTFLCPPSKKRGILLCTCRLVGMSVGWSVDQTMSSQYLENLSLDYDISYVGWWWVEEDPYWFWGQ